MKQKDGDFYVKYLKNHHKLYFYLMIGGEAFCIIFKESYTSFQAHYNSIFNVVISLLLIIFIILIP